MAAQRHDDSIVVGLSPCEELSRTDVCMHVRCVISKARSASARVKMCMGDGVIPSLYDRSSVLTGVSERPIAFHAAFNGADDESCRVLRSMGETLHRLRRDGEVSTEEQLRYCLYLARLIMILWEAPELASASGSVYWVYDNTACNCILFEALNR